MCTGIVVFSDVGTVKAMKACILLFGTLSKFPTTSKNQYFFCKKKEIEYFTTFSDNYWPLGHIFVFIFTKKHTASLNRIYEHLDHLIG